MDVNIQKYQAFLKAIEYGSFTKSLPKHSPTPSPGSAG